MPIRVTVWNENVHEKKHAKVQACYPNGIHEAIAEGLRACPDFQVRTATLDQPEQGLPDDVLNNTDVLTWWGHMAHGAVEDKNVARVQERVLEGMGLIVLHSGHFSKIFQKLMGTTCNLKWRELDDKEILWVCKPGHPIVEGVNDKIILPQEEMYGEHFDIPEADETIFISWFTHGEVFRSGCTWRRGAGKIFYFRPGHETHPTYFNPEIRKVIANAVKWAAPSFAIPKQFYGNQKPIV